MTEDLEWERNAEYDRATEFIGPAPKPYDRFVPPGRLTSTVLTQAWSIPVPALPWGDQDLANMKMSAIADVSRLRIEGSPLVMDHGQMSSDPDRWSVSQGRADQMLKDIILWQPEEGVVPQHRADARELVYKTFLQARMLPGSARRRPRSKMHV